MICCHAAQKTPQCEPIVKGKERKRGRLEGQREEGAEREEGRGRKRGGKEEERNSLKPSFRLTSSEGHHVCIFLKFSYAAHD